MSDIENLTIMFTDIVGFSRLVSSLSRAESESLLKHHNSLLKKIVTQFRGQHIKSIGDSFLVVFRSPTDAVLCAMAMQDSLWEHNQEEVTKHKLTIRIALNTGEVRLAGGDVFGEAVNIASRLEAQTPGGKIYLTEAVYLSMNKNEVVLDALDEFQFKGIPNPIRVYNVKNKPLAETSEQFQGFPFGGAHYQLQPASRSIFTFGKAFVGVNTAIVAAFFTWWATVTYMPPPDHIEMDKIAVEYRQPQPFNEVFTDTNTENTTVGFVPTITQEIQVKAKPLVDEKNYLGLKNIIDEYKEAHKDNAYLNLLQGHVAMYYKEFEQATDHYKIALTEDSFYSWHALAAKNLVKLLDHQRIPANQLLGSNLSKPVIDELSARTGKSGLRARYDAFYLLKDSGNIDKVDKVGLNIWDLRELEECRLKQVAVKELARLKDPRALPALKELVDLPWLKRIPYTCLRKDAKKAIASIIETESEDTVQETKPEAKLKEKPKETSNTADIIDEAEEESPDELSALEIGVKQIGVKQIGVKQVE